MTTVDYQSLRWAPESTHARHYDLMIVGGGLVGLTLANALKDSGLQLAVVEAQTPEQAAGRDRAYAFSLTSGEIFKQLGLWDAIAPRITHFQQVRLSDSDFPITVNFRPEDIGTESVYYAAEHSVLMAALQQNLAGCPAIDYLAPAQLTTVTYGADAVECVLEYQDKTWHCTTALMVAADGPRSRLREQAQIPTFGWQYWQSCVTTVLATEKFHANTAYERFWPSGPFAILPLADGRCQIVWTAPHAEAEALLQLPEAAFMEQLRQRYGDQMGDLQMLHPPLLFPVRLMHSRHYVRPRLALVGDAAHGCHPVGGQGLNMGIRDAAALAEILIEAHQRGEAVGSLRVLQRYERWRKRENWLVLTMTDLLNRGFSNRWLPLVGLRRLGLLLLASLPPLKWLALSIMTGRFGRSPQLPSSAVNQ